MPSIHLRHGRRYCLGYCSDIRTEVTDNIGYPSLSRRHAGGKALWWLYLPAAHVLIRPGSSSDGTDGYVADTSAAYENQALLVIGL